MIAAARADPVKIAPDPDGASRIIARVGKGRVAAAQARRPDLDLASISASFSACEGQARPLECPRHGSRSPFSGRGPGHGPAAKSRGARRGPTQARRAGVDGRPADQGRDGPRYAADERARGAAALGPCGVGREVDVAPARPTRAETTEAAKRSARPARPSPKPMPTASRPETAPRAVGLSLVRSMRASRSRSIQLLIAQEPPTRRAVPATRSPPCRHRGRAAVAVPLRAAAKAKPARAVRTFDPTMPILTREMKSRGRIMGIA
jgi:hypothetical protein